MFGTKVREIREEKGLFLRQMAAHLEVDTAYVSKIETSGRNASKEQVLGIAEFLETDKQELLTLWLADRIHELIQEENYALDALELVKKKL
ncbi:helix-turn-helix domain-containing protein [Flavobacteriales bacterium]|nr:helix-turn-helix domain-containing protein [Flavobacteriales bacterium]